MTHRLGRYEIQEEIARGAMSIVYKGFDPDIKRTLAIKVLRPEFARRPEYRTRFLKEARAAGTLTHSSIVTIFDVGETGGVPFIAMELLEGPTLYDVIRENRNLGLGTIVDMAIQLADALDYAHRNSIIHRDVKPENVIWLQSENRVKITDFGIARLIDDTQRQTGDTRLVAGTPIYMSPEQITGGEVDGRSDLYSLGVVLYALLAGRPPFRMTEIHELQKRIVSDPAPKLKPRNPLTPRALKDVVMTLLSKMPEDRYQTGAELRHELEQIRRQVRDSGAASRRWIVPIRVRWASFMALLVAVTVLVGLGVVYTKQNGAITSLAYDYGASLSRIIAAESAEALLLKDQIALQTTVDDMRSNRDMVYLSIADHNGIVRASTTSAHVGKSMSVIPRGALVKAISDREHVYRLDVKGSGGELLFDTPIYYQDKLVGQVDLGLSTATLHAANRATLMAMLALLVVTVVTVSIGAYLVSKRLSLPVEMLRAAIDRITQGDFSARIRLRRRDEFSRVFSAFNMMAELLEARSEARQSRPGHPVPADTHPGERTTTVEVPLESEEVDKR